jgi:hypothetical protein
MTVSHCQKPKPFQTPSDCVALPVREVKENNRFKARKRSTSLASRAIQRSETASNAERLLLKSAKISEITPSKKLIPKQSPSVELSCEA